MDLINRATASNTLVTSLPKYISILSFAYLNRIPEILVNTTGNL